jgi:predicted transcriptional regulator
MGQREILEILKGSPGMTARQISERSGADVHTTLAYLSRLMTWNDISSVCNHGTRTFSLKNDR